MSLAELEAAAMEAGIEPAAVRRAAQELELGRSATLARPTPSDASSSLARGFAGAPMRLRVERLLPEPYRADLADRVAAELRAQLGDIVETASEFSRTWSVARGKSGEGRDIRVTLSERGDVAVLRIEERNGSLAGGMFGGIVGGVGGGGLGFVIPSVVAVLSSVWVPLVMLVWVAMVFGVVRLGFRAVVKRRQAELRALADDIEAVVRARALPTSA